MDDLLHGDDDERKLAETAVQIDSILREANFKLRKWKSNSPAVLDIVNASLQHRQPSTKPISLGPGETQKVLGLAWSCHNDDLSYTLKREAIPKQLTKRKVLSVASTIFDPLGLLGPIIIVAKCFIQRLWKIKSNWDEPIPNYLYNEWVTFYNKLFFLEKLSIPRHVIATNYVTIELHGYCDSSMTAFGAVVYLRSIDDKGNIFVRLLCSKSRVARQESIPRLELRSAVLLANLFGKVKNALKIEFSKMCFWSDSSVALAWIKSKQPNKLQCFVRNRVTEINKLTSSNDWHWVSSADNPADLLSRGLDANKLQECSLLWQGPSWLTLPNTRWPSFEVPNTESSILLVDETHCSLTLNVVPNQFMINLYGRWSSFARLIRCFAYILRFINNTRSSTNKLFGPLSVNELRESTNKLIQFAQIEVYPNEYKLLKHNKPIPKCSNLLSVNPFMQDDLMRVGGRLGLSSYDHNKKHPIILPHGHTLSKLIAHSEHVRLMHAGPQLLLASIRERYWPIHGKKLVNQVVHKCVTCFRAKPTQTSPIMGNLPISRVRPAPPFFTTCVDYGGPFLIRDRRGRGAKTSKCYIAIFVCLVVKAVHIELVTGLETSAFLLAFRRFISRRGRPKEMLSDNGTTFHGANNELRDLYQFLDENSGELVTSSAREGIKWSFLPPYTPQMGGLHEASIRACKQVLKRVLGQALLTYEEFSTILIQIEGILNSRPLCPVPSSDSDEITFLSPAHFLIGRTPISMPDYDYTDVPSNRLTHYQQLQQLQQDFWHRWSRDYIGLLQERTKWRSTKGPGLQAGTIVLIKEARLPPCQWRLGRIVGCCQGRDGVTRVAEIKTNTGVIKRAFNNLCPLPIKNVD